MGWAMRRSCVSPDPLVESAKDFMSKFDSARALNHRAEMNRTEMSLFGSVAVDRWIADLGKSQPQTAHKGLNAADREDVSLRRAEFAGEQINPCVRFDAADF